MLLLPDFSFLSSSHSDLVFSPSLFPFRSFNMGSVTSPTEGKIILITGINGYVASTVGLSLLQHGYTVRGTSRDPAHEAVLRNGPYKPHSSNFQYVCVADITVPGAFDKAVTGVFSILPMAAPVSFAVQGLEAFMGPAVKSVTSILHSAVKHAGPQLSSVVYLSSVAAVWDYAVGMADPSYEFSEKDWNEWAEKTALEVGDENGAWLMWYPASKAAAEKAIWKFKDENKVRRIGLSCRMATWRSTRQVRKYPDESLAPSSNKLPNTS